jgi:GT2 family glycosyltransferase
MDAHISVIIPTYNRSKSLMRTLKALESQSLSPDNFEIIVISDGSTDNTASFINGYTPPYRLRFYEQKNCGPSVARNLGARSACGNILVFVDDDIEPVPGFLEEHLQPHLKDDRLVLIGPQSPPPDERFPVWIEWEHHMLERQYTRFESGEWAIGPNNLYSGNFSISASNFIQSGGFDENFKRQEDVELGFRLGKMGLNFKYIPRAIGYHRPERSFASWQHAPYLYGIRDVQMSRDKNQEQALQLARKHYKQRNRITRMLARTFIGHYPGEKCLLESISIIIPFIDKLGGRSIALELCSLLFNLRYLQGMAQEMGGADKMWQTLIMDSPSEAESR